MIGAVGVLAAGSTFALFNDTETSDTNTFRVGAFDMAVEAEKLHNGEQVEAQFGEGAAPIFEINDVKPGDVISNEVEIEMEGNPGFVEMEVNKTEDGEASCTEPEAEAEGGDCGTEGELYENMEMSVYMENGNSGQQMIYEGSAENFDNQSMYLDADPSSGIMDAFDNTTTHTVVIEANIPRDTGNEMQTDTGEFTYGFNAVQARHNSVDNN